MLSSYEPTIDAWWRGELSEPYEGLLDLKKLGVWGENDGFSIGFEVRDLLG